MVKDNTNQETFMKITFKDVVYTLIFGALIFGLGIWQGKKECEEKLKLQESKTEWKVIDGAKVSTYPKNITFEFSDPNKVITTINISYFPAEEVEIINAAAKRNNLKGFLYPILYAIRKAENGAKRRELGIIHPRCEVEMDKRPNETLDIQAGWAAATVQKNYDRWIKAGKPNDYITYLGHRFCPEGAVNDPDGLNKNWIPNVNSWIKKIRG